MITQYFNAIENPENGSLYAGEIIRRGGLVAFPTETVYGLGANALNANAIKNIFKAKGRPSDNPLILHIANPIDVSLLWENVPDAAQALINAFWPGPLTLIYIKNSAVPDEVTAGLDTAAVRMPNHKTALSLIHAAGVPIAAPSANISGRPSPTRAEHVIADLDGKIDALIDGGECQVGVESTVLSIVGEPTILRPGAVTAEMLKLIIGSVRISSAVLAPLDANEAPQSPGMKHIHYAPDAQVFVAQGDPCESAVRISEAYAEFEREGKRCIIFATAQTQGFYSGLHYVTIGDRNCPSTLCSALFSALRGYGNDYDVILAETVDSSGIGLAYMNRLLRAAGFKTI